MPTHPIRTVECRIERVEALTTSVHRLILQGPVDIRHEPGQYLELEVILEEGPRWLPFSIANACQQSGVLELHVQYVAKSKALATLWRELLPGRSLRVRLPKGNCILKYDDDAPLMLIAAGTGYAQMKAIIEAALARNPHREIELWWGAHTRQELYADQDIRAWCRQYSGLAYHPVVEREDEADFDGVIARIDRALAAHVTHTAHYSIFLSGSPGMVYGVVDTLEQLGPLTERLFSDVFSYAPRT